jgi:hypothetical protein
MNTVKSKLWEGKNLGDGSGIGSDTAFNGERPISRNTPGIKDFNPATNTVIDFLEKVFYPAVPPLAAISVDNPIREIGQSAAYTLTWSATQQTNAITGINVDGTAITLTGGSQAGTQSGTLPSTSGNYTKSMTDTDGTLSGSASCTISYKSRFFWGTTSKTSGITDADILALANSELRDTRNKNFGSLGGDAKHLIFAFPSAFGTPSFVVNGLANTAFTKVRAASNFVNVQGATIVMDVWISDNIYNSPLASVIIN